MSSSTAFFSPCFDSPDRLRVGRINRKRPSDDVIGKLDKKPIVVDQDGTSRDSGFGDDWSPSDVTMTSSFTSFDFLEDSSCTQKTKTSPIGNTHDVTDNSSPSCFRFTERLRRKLNLESIAIDDASPQKLRRVAESRPIQLTEAGSFFDESFDRLHSERDRLHRKRRTATAHRRSGASVGADPADNPIEVREHCLRSDDLIGDFSRSFSLPFVESKHPDLKAITPDTLAELLSGTTLHHNDAQCLVIDCRYPFEYIGGHIRGAVNIYTKSTIEDFLTGENCPSMVVFHCEFSSKRGPSLARFLRESDRRKHIEQYPRLSFPEVYILDGGYKAFYERHAQLCTPCDYLPMMHPDHRQSMRRSRAQCKRISKALKQASAPVSRLPVNATSDVIARPEVLHF